MNVGIQEKIYIKTHLKIYQNNKIKMDHQMLPYHTSRWLCHISPYLFVRKSKHLWHLIWFIKIWLTYSWYWMIGKCSFGCGHEIWYAFWICVNLFFLNLICQSIFIFYTRLNIINPFVIIKLPNDNVPNQPICIYVQIFIKTM